MKVNRARIFVWWVVICVVMVSAAVLAGPASPAFVAFSLDEHGAVVVPVFIDGAGPFSFLVDTGSSRSAVGEDLAARLAAPAVARTLVVTAAGTVTRPVVRLGSVSLGSSSSMGAPMVPMLPLLVDGLLAAVVPMPRVELAGVTIAGILGQDFLSRFNYTLDYRRRRLTWDGEPHADAGRDGVRLTLQRSEGRFLVELPQAGIGGRVVRFVPDTGASEVVVFERPGAAPLPMDATADEAEMTSVSGRRDVKVRRLRVLQVGAIALRNRRATVVERLEPDAPEGDGLLPLHLFSSVSFNCREGYMVIR